MDRRHNKQKLLETSCTRRARAGLALTLDNSRHIPTSKSYMTAKFWYYILGAGQFEKILVRRDRHAIVDFDQLSKAGHEYVPWDYTWVTWRIRYIIILCNPRLCHTFHFPSNFTNTSKMAYRISPHPTSLTLCPHPIPYASALRIWGSCGSSLAI